MVRNYYPHKVEELPTNDETGKGLAATKMPQVELLDGRVLVRPTICDLADELGITELPEPHTIYALQLSELVQQVSLQRFTQLRRPIHDCD